MTRGIWCYNQKPSLTLGRDNLRSRTVREYLVRWRNLLDEDANWESEKILQHLSLQLLEDKQHFGREDCNIPN